MIIHNCEQGTHEWLRLRAGIPTASNFAKILSPGGKPSKSAETYMHGLVAEWIVGHPISGPESEWMARGNEYEAQAVKAYEFQMDATCEKVGFITTDDAMVGCSPDRLVGADKIAEFKCPKHSTHVGYLLGEPVDQEYKPQLQGQLWITGRQSADIVAYHPEMPMVVINVPRDEEYIALLEHNVEVFIRGMISTRDEISRRFGPFDREAKQPEGQSFLNITDDDIDWLAENSTYTGETVEPQAPVPVSDPVNPAVREAIKFAFRRGTK